MLNESSALENNDDFIKIRLPYPINFISDLGYDGHSSYVGIWLLTGTNAVHWFDGLSGAPAKDTEVWNSWLEEREVQFALRNIEFISDETEGGFALIFDQDHKAIFVCQKKKMREILYKLAKTQNLESFVHEILTEEEREIAQKEGLSIDLVERIANFGVRGSKASTLH